MASRLERALRTIGKRRRAERPQPVEGLSAGAFRAVADERLRNVERQLEELKARVNGLLFLLAGAVATQVLMKLLE